MNCPSTTDCGDGWWQEWTHESHNWVCPRCYNQRALINLKERMLKEILDLQVDGESSHQIVLSQIKQRAYEAIKRVDIYEP